MSSSCWYNVQNRLRANHNRRTECLLDEEQGEFCRPQNNQSDNRLYEENTGDGKYTSCTVNTSYNLHENYVMRSFLNERKSTCRWRIFLKKFNQNSIRKNGKKIVNILKKVRDIKWSSYSRRNAKWCRLPTVGDEWSIRISRTEEALEETMYEGYENPQLTHYILNFQEEKRKLTERECDSINNCLLLLRNVLHIPEAKGVTHCTIQNQIVWNLFVQNIDKVLIHLMTCEQKVSKQIFISGTNRYSPWATSDFPHRMSSFLIELPLTCDHRTSSTNSLNS